MKILVVDDEELLVKGIRFNLMNEGYQVITGNTGLEALQKVQSEAPDLVVLDVMMPEMDGIPKLFGFLRRSFDFFEFLNIVTFLQYRTRIN